MCHLYESRSLMGFFLSVELEGIEVHMETESRMIYFEFVENFFKLSFVISYTGTKRLEF